MSLLSFHLGGKIQLASFQAPMTYSKSKQ